MHHAPRSDVDRDAKVVRGTCGENEKRFRMVCMFCKASHAATRELTVNTSKYNLEYKSNMQTVIKKVKRKPEFVKWKGRD